MASYSFPPGWESDYDGANQRWFFVHRPTGFSQSMFPKAGDELVQPTGPVEMFAPVPEPPQMGQDTLGEKIDAMVISSEQQSASTLGHNNTTPHAQNATQTTETVLRSEHNETLLREPVTTSGNISPLTTPAPLHSQVEQSISNGDEAGAPSQQLTQSGSSPVQQQQQPPPTLPIEQGFQPHVRPISGIQQYSQYSAKPQANQVIRRKPMGSSPTQQRSVSGEMNPRSPTAQVPAYQVQQPNWQPQPLSSPSGQAPLVQGQMPVYQQQSFQPGAQEDRRQSGQYQQQVSQQNSQYTQPQAMQPQGVQQPYQTSIQRQGSVMSQHEVNGQNLGYPDQVGNIDQSQAQQHSTDAQSEPQSQQPNNQTPPTDAFHVVHSENASHASSPQIQHSELPHQNTGSPSLQNATQARQPRQPQGPPPGHIPGPPSQVPSQPAGNLPQNPMNPEKSVASQTPELQNRRLSSISGASTVAYSPHSTPSPSQQLYFPPPPPPPESAPQSAQAVPNQTLQPQYVQVGQQHGSQQPQYVQQGQQLQHVQQGQQPGSQQPQYVQQGQQLQHVQQGQQPGSQQLQYVQQGQQVGTQQPQYVQQGQQPQYVQQGQQVGTQSQQPQYMPAPSQSQPQSPVPVNSPLPAAQFSHLYRAQSGPASSTFAQLVERDTVMANNAMQNQSQYTSQGPPPSPQNQMRPVRPVSYAQQGGNPQQYQAPTSQYQQPMAAYNPSTMGALTAPAAPDPMRIQPYQQQFTGPPPNPGSLPAIGSTRPGMMTRWSTNALTSSKKGLEKSKGWIKKNPMGTIAMVGGLGVVAEACGVPVLKDAMVAGKVYNNVQANKARQQHLQAQQAAQGRAPGTQPAGAPAGAGTGQPMSEAAMQAAIQKGIQEGMRQAMLAQQGGGQPPGGVGRGMPVGQQQMQQPGGMGRGAMPGQQQNVQYMPQQTPGLQQGQILQQNMHLQQQQYMVIPQQSAPSLQHNQVPQQNLQLQNAQVAQYQMQNRLGQVGLQNSQPQGQQLLPLQPGQPQGPPQYIPQNQQPMNTQPGRQPTGAPPGQIPQQNLQTQQRGIHPQGTAHSQQGVHHTQSHPQTTNHQNAPHPQYQGQQQNDGTQSANTHQPQYTNPNAQYNTMPTQQQQPSSTGGSIMGGPQFGAQPPQDPSLVSQIAGAYSSHQQNAAAQTQLQAQSAYINNSFAPPPTASVFTSGPEYQTQTAQDPSLITQLVGAYSAQQQNAAVQAQVQSQIQAQAQLQSSLLNTSFAPPPTFASSGSQNTIRSVDVGDTSTSNDFSASTPDFANNDRDVEDANDSSESLEALQVQNRLEEEGQLNALSLIDGTEYKVTYSDDDDTGNDALDLI